MGLTRHEKRTVITVGILGIAFVIARLFFPSTQEFNSFIQHWELPILWFVVLPIVIYISADLEGKRSKK